jgi:quercetin dioxygenase-like cupin family protein
MRVFADGHRSVPAAAKPKPGLRNELVDEFHNNGFALTMNMISLLPRLLFFCGLPLFAQLPLSGFAAEGAPPAQTNLAGTSSAPATAKPVMRSRVFPWSDMKVQPSNIGVFRGVFDDPTATLDKFSCHVTTLNPGKEPHPAHRHPEEELIIVKEGTLEVVQNSVTNHVAAGGMIFCASNELHGWRNTSAHPVTYYVLKVYPHDLKMTVGLEEPKPNK